MRIIHFILAMLSLMGAGCSRNTAVAEQNTSEAVIPAFDADSAFAYVEAQTQQGPRVPGTTAHRATAQWLEQRLAATHPDTMMVQRFTARRYDGVMYPLMNIWASYNSRARRRILLVAHWDTRPWADSDPNPDNHSRPIDGANDGASGVGVLLEVVRQLSLQRPEAGVDILLVDGEDSGRHDDGEGGDDDTWCLGSQYWAENMPYPLAADRPQAGVLLDMVGGRGAKFHKEYFSQQGARTVTEALWKAARRAGYSHVFVDAQGGAVNDDHLPLIRAGIPVTDVIECRSDATGSFPSTWHTLDDNLTNIDPASLKAAGQTVLQYIYQ